LPAAITATSGTTGTLDAAKAAFRATTASVLQTDRRTGWTVGGGVEYALGCGWSIRGEYLYVDLGSWTTFNTPPSPDLWSVAFPFLNLQVKHGQPGILTARL